MNAVRFGDNTFLVELSTELIDSDEKPILNASVPKSPSKRNSILLDFSAVQIMNGLGASMLVKLSALTRRHGQRLLAFGVSNHYRDVLKLTGLEQVIAIYNNEEDAFTAAGVPTRNQSPGEVRQNTSQDISYWAKPVSRLNVPPMPPEAINKNMKGRRVVGPVDGFGQLWQKTYRLRVDKPGFTVEDIIKTLKQNFPSFQPSFNRFYPSSAGLIPGEVVAIDSSTPGGPVSTGVMVLYADNRSFTFITPQGHPESGWVTFSAFETEGKITAQIMGLARANDPVYEAAFHLIGSEMQIKIWKYVLTSLANYLEIPANVTVEPVCIDTHLQWSQVRNVWYNAQIRTFFYMPFRWLGKSLKGVERKEK
jgi:anti-anti-sigma factor